MSRHAARERGNEASVYLSSGRRAIRDQARHYAQLHQRDIGFQKLVRGGQDPIAELAAPV